MAYKKSRKTLRKRNFKKVRKVRISKPKGGDIISSNNYCTITETSQDAASSVVNENNVMTVTTNIANYPRAFAMSKFFRWFRPKLLTYKYIPLYTDFAEGGGSKPEFLYVMNRTGDIVNPTTKNQMLAMGAKPQGFSKTKVISYRPNLCQVVQVAQGVGGPPLSYNNYNIGSVPIYNWVQTYTAQLMGAPANFDDGSALQGMPTSNRVQWQGHKALISTSVPAGATPVAKVYCECIWEFKEPLYSSPLAELPLHEV